MIHYNFVFLKETVPKRSHSVEGREFSELITFRECRRQSVFEFYLVPFAQFILWELFLLSSFSHPVQQITRTGSAAATSIGFFKVDIPRSCEQLDRQPTFY